MGDRFYCHASVNYSLGMDERVPRDIEVFDGRARTDLSWAENGFQLIEHASSVSDWDSNQGLRDVYYGEMETLARTLTGARAAIISSHINRNPEAEAKHADYGPVRFVHSDFGDDYGEFLKAYYQEDDPHAEAARVRHQLTKADFANAARVMILQFWRNVGSSTMDTPLALCDSQSITREDLLQFKMPGYGGNGRAFDAFLVKPPVHKPHRWYTFTDLGVDEVIAIRTFDSDAVDRGSPYWTPHSAIDDPNVTDGPSRRSVEVRALCVF